MLAGIAPLMIFQFKIQSTALSDKFKDVPIVSDIPTLLDQPPIPLYMDEDLTGVWIDTEDRNIDISTDIQTKSNGKEPEPTQKGVDDSITINLLANKNATGLVILNAMAKKILQLVTSREYAVTWLNGGTTVFRGLLHSYSVSANANTDLINIRIVIGSGKKTPQVLPDSNPAALIPVEGTQPLDPAAV